MLTPRDTHRSAPRSTDTFCTERTTQLGSASEVGRPRTPRSSQRTPFWRGALLFCGIACLISSHATADAIVATGAGEARLRGVYELTLKSSTVEGPLEARLEVTFVRPDDSEVTIDGFYDGDDIFRARAYCDAAGTWSWRTRCADLALDRKSGSFVVRDSSLPGKLRLHGRDSRQFAYDSGEWFLHIGDTGYRYVVDTEPHWQAYIDQAAAMGATKIRTWFCRSRSGVEALLLADRSGLDIAYWQEIDRRVRYALERHPRVMLSLIVYGEDTAELRRYGRGDPMAMLVARYAQARFSALPNVTWCISNDREIVGPEKPLKGRRVRAATIDRIGTDMAAREPWGTLITNHQCRFSGYAFVDASWSDVITIEDLDQIDGEILRKYRDLGSDPVVNDEDRYELYRPPRHPRYFFRRLMWSSLLSGAHATYGGLKTYEPFGKKATGVSGYHDAVRDGLLRGGADDFRFIHAFFRETTWTLVGMIPDDTVVGGDPTHRNCLRDDRRIIVYLANPTGSKAETDDAAATSPAIAIRLPPGSYRTRWFDPDTGRWLAGADVSGGSRKLTAPGGGDWVLALDVR